MMSDLIKSCQTMSDFLKLHPFSRILAVSVEIRILNFIKTV